MMKLKPWALKCCGCNALLGSDGQPVRLDPGTAAFPLDRIATFDTKEEADRFALDHGWTVTDSAGTNHRCPDCAAEEKRSKVSSHRRGAYISTDTWRTT